MLKKFLGGVVVAASLVANPASATIVLDSWYLNPTGSGFDAAALIVNDYVGTNGQAMVVNTFTSATTFTFQESARFKGDTTNTFPNDLIIPRPEAVFFGTGSGSIGAGGGALTFDPGASLTFYKGGMAHVAANAIATFGLLQGTANLFGNSTLPNGDISLIFQASSFTTGYFFDQNGVDLSTLILGPDPVVIGLVTTNAGSLDGPITDTALISDFNTAFATGYATPLATGPTYNPLTTSVGDTQILYIKNGGQFDLKAVPEPGSLALIGAALGAAALIGRRRNKVVVA